MMRGHIVRICRPQQSGNRKTRRTFLGPYGISNGSAVPRPILEDCIHNRLCIFYSGISLSVHGNSPQFSLSISFISSPSNILFSGAPFAQGQTPLAFESSASRGHSL